MNKKSNHCNFPHVFKEKKKNIYLYHVPLTNTHDIRNSILRISIHLWPFDDLFQGHASNSSMHLSWLLHSFTKSSSLMNGNPLWEHFNLFLLSIKTFIAFEEVFSYTMLPQSRRLDLCNPTHEKSYSISHLLDAVTIQWPCTVTG